MMLAAVVSLLFLTFSAIHGTVGIVTECERYDSKNCANGSVCIQKDICNEGSNPSCFVAWQSKIGRNEQELLVKGCAYNHQIDCRNETVCLGDLRSSKNGTETFYCCCLANNCNAFFAPDPNPPMHVPSLENAVPIPHDNSIGIITLIWTAALLMVLALSLAGYWFYRRNKLSLFNELPTSDTACYECPALVQNTIPVHLMEIKARGRFGAVWKANRKADIVAVKIFPPQDKLSWMAELEVYKLPLMEHENILTFLGAEKRGDNIQAEYLLITEFHELGSLCDYLKANSVTWPELCRIAVSMAAGLSHLHEEVHAKDGSVKPAVAHRDFKSKNVLLKSDLTACIADFGLALIFTPGKAVGDVHGQVGTRRYMAPEVLEGAISFSRDSFLRIDMYAVSLVLWELMTRCSSVEGGATEYMLPFEAEVGQHPALESMQECVAHQKRRPSLKPAWRSHPGMAAFCSTIEECWDGDSEARLSASCVLERLTVMNRLHTPQTNKLLSIPSLIPTMNPSYYSSVLLDSDE